MTLSYSFHLSSKSNAVSSISKIKKVSKHNLRNYKSEDYDKEKINILVGGDKSVFQNIQEIYHREFDEVLKIYNDKQKREDRKIDDYLEHISESKSDVAAEIIIQVGDRDFWSNVDKENWKVMNTVFENQLTELKKLVPEFKVASAVVHLDESSPHLHVVGVPIAGGFKKGLEKQVSKTKIFTKKSLSELQDKMRENMELEMKSEKYSIIFEELAIKEKEKGRNKDMPKHKLDEFYQLQKDVQKLKDDKEHLHSKIQELKTEKVTLKDEIKTIKSDRDELLSNKAELERSKSELKEEIEQLKNELSSINSDIAETEQRLDSIFDKSHIQELAEKKISFGDWVKKYIVPLANKLIKEYLQTKPQFKRISEHSESVLRQIKDLGTQTSKSAKNSLERGKNDYER